MSKEKLQIKKKYRRKKKKYKYKRKGEPGRACIFCGRPTSIIRKYDLCVCRECFREKAARLGFHKYG